MGMLVNPWRHPVIPFSDIEALFANGEIGDYWRFDAANTDANAEGDSITAATGLVSGRILEDAVPSNAPRLRLPGGREAARFDGDADRLIYNFGSTVAQPGTIIVCLTNSNTVPTVIVTGSSTTSRWQISIDSDGDLTAYAGAELDSTINGPIGTKVLTVEFNGASSKFRVNGTQTATGNAGSQGTDQITLGSLWDGQFGTTSDIYSLLFIDRLLDPTTELDPVERLLGSHAGLSW